VSGLIGRAAPTEAVVMTLLPQVPSSRRGGRLAALALAALALAAAVPASPAGAVEYKPGAPVPGVKPPLVGFMPRGAVIEDAWAGIVTGTVVNISWAELEPTEAAPLPAFTQIDNALKRVRKYNLAHPDAPIGIRLRVLAGRNAPQWLKDKAGSTFVQNPSGPETGTVPFWWKSEVDVAYRRLQRNLALRYDSVPELREVQITRCSLIFGEPFLRLRTDASYDVFRANGLTRAADEACLRQQIAAHKVWKTTRSNLALNPYQDVEYRDGHPDVAFTFQMAGRCRDVLGERCTLDNHSLRDGVQIPEYAEMYEGMRTMGGHNVVQSANASKVGDWTVTFQRVRLYELDSIELPTGYHTQDVAQFRATHAETLAYFDEVRVALGV
jgi:hypothetical protein